MTDLQIIWTILIAAAVTVFTRALPFLAFRKGHTPAFITWLGAQLPSAVMAMLLVYCLRSISFTTGVDDTPAIPAIAGVVTTAALHVWKKKMILSISAGTLVYMVLLRVML